MSNSFVFYESFTDAIDRIPDDSVKLEIYEAIVHYGTKGILPENLSPYAAGYFDLVKPNIDSNVKKRTGGSKGGRPKKTKGYENEKPMVSENENLRLENCETNVDVDVDVDVDKDVDVDVNADVDVDVEADADNKGVLSDDNTLSAEPTVRVPYQRIVNEFNRCCPSLPKVKAISDQRKKHIKSIYQQYGMSAMFDVFDAVERSDFLSGRSGQWGNCGFDWIMKPSNFLKILEGNYENKASPASSKIPGHDELNEYYHMLSEWVDEYEDGDDDG